MFSGEDVLTLGMKLIGVFFLVQSLPELISECLMILHPLAEPVRGLPDVLPLVRPLVTLLLGCLCAFGTATLTRLLTANQNSEPLETQ